MTDPLLFVNGVDGSTGAYLLPPLTPADLSAAARGEWPDPAHLKELKGRQRRAEATLGPIEGINPKDLAQTGWGIIFPHDAHPLIRESLSDLLALRKKQAGARNSKYYREFVGPDGYRPGESKVAFLARHGVGLGPADPENMPYYLLIVGDPEIIPFTFQYQLDVQYAVGRVQFDTPDEYLCYARSVVAAETGQIRLAQRAVFFGVCNPDDHATALSATELVEPLAGLISGGHPDWTVQSWLAADATKQRLTTLMGGEAPPALLFTASHGLGFPCRDPNQLRRQGALLCQDWPGPEAVAWSDPLGILSVGRRHRFHCATGWRRLLPLRLLRGGHAASGRFCSASAWRPARNRSPRLHRSAATAAPRPPERWGIGRRQPCRSGLGLFVLVAQSRPTARGLSERAKEADGGSPDRFRHGIL